ncbi:MAG: hypothetical protein GH143_09500 [Calditrichaeota bacterium]|nr:hypothetical protein [Calditrichota bacterium]
MIYLPPDPSDPIRQGDIFRDIPRADISLNQLAEIQDNHLVKTTWLGILSSGASDTTIAAKIKCVDAIIITQDCDALRSPDISLCEIVDFKQLFPGDTPGSISKWVKTIIRQSKINLKWFYLPPSNEVGFNEKKVVDFQTIIRINREDMEQLRQDYRIGRLNDVATEHFRERLGEFFRRYPYNEWYPFNKEEFEKYREIQSSSADIRPYEYQK